MTTTYSLEKTFEWNFEITDKVAAVMRAFGLSVQRMRSNAVAHKCEVRLSPGDICYLTGASGSGKSVLLCELYNAVKDDSKIRLSDIELPADMTCIDSVDGHFLDVLRTLSKAGLGDVFCVLNSPANLSDGQKYRFRLAKAMASGAKFIFADEFCSNLDRITAAVISHNIAAFAKRNGITFILASSHNDLLADLTPDIIVTKQLAGTTEVIYKNQRKPNIYDKMHCNNSSENH